MKELKLIEDLLKKYEYNKVRIVFLQNQKQRVKTEESSEYIKSKMFRRGFSGSIPKLVFDRGEEIAKLNQVEETAINYKEKIQEEYNRAMQEMDKEIKQLQYTIEIIDDSLELLKTINEKYHEILQKNFIHKCNMEDIADSMHMSRSRCYELRKSALELVVRIVFGDGALLEQTS